MATPAKPKEAAPAPTRLQIEGLDQLIDTIVKRGTAMGYPPDPEFAKKVVDSVLGKLATGEAVFGQPALPKSPLTPEQAKDQLDVWGLVALGIYAAGAAACIVAEAAGFGQMETPIWAFMDAYSTTGGRELIKEYVLGAWYDAILPAVRKYWLSVYQSEVPSIEILATMRLRGAIDDSEFYKKMSYWGFDANHAFYYLNALVRMQDQETLLTLRRRGSMSEGEYHVRMSCLGWPPLEAARTYDSRSLIPGPADLVRFVVREVISPAEFTAWMNKQWFDPYWAGTYWEAHWMLPPTERIRTSFLRKQLSEEEYRKYLVWWDFKPEPRPDIKKSDVDIMLETQYDWPGRIETRWMLEWGEISPTEAEDILRADGLDPAWSPRVARAYLLNQLRDEHNRVRTTLMTRYKEGFLKKAAFEDRLKTLNFAAHTISASLEWAEEATLWDDVWEQAQEWWRLAKAEKITPEKYAEEVRALGMVEERITSKMALLRKLAAIAAVK